MVKIFTITIFIFQCLIFCAQDYSENDLSGFSSPFELCQESEPICSLLGFLGSVGAINNSGGPVCGSQFFLHNSFWFSFIATSHEVSIEIAPRNCINIDGGLGLQATIVSECPAGFPFLSVGNCQARCMNEPFVIGTSDPLFKVGQQYWVLIDGCSASICDFEITAVHGAALPILSLPSRIVTNEFAIAGEKLQITLETEIPALNYIWQLDGVELITDHFNMLDIPADFPAGTYQLCLMDARNHCMGIAEDFHYIPGTLCIEIEIINDGFRDGSIHFSVNSNYSDLLISPNPVSNELVVNLESFHTDEFLDIKVFDLQGNSYLWQRLHYPDGSFKIPVSELKAGIYMLQVNSDRLVRTGRFVKIN